MTTNGILLTPLAPALKAAGLGRVTVSLDTLRRDRFIALSRQDELARTLAGIDTAAREFPGFKIDTVVIRGVNDDEIVDLRRLRARTRRRDPLHRIHGRRRRDRLVGGAGDVARRDPRAHRRRLRAGGAGGEGTGGAGRPLPAARRHAVRRHRLDHRAVLPRLRSRPPDRRRRALPVPLRHARSRPARAAARRRQRRRSRGAHHRDVAGAHRPRRRSPPRRARSPAAHSGELTQARPASGNAHRGARPA